MEIFSLLFQELQKLHHGPLKESRMLQLNGNEQIGIKELSEHSCQIVGQSPKIVDLKVLQLLDVFVVLGKLYLESNQC